MFGKRNKSKQEKQNKKIKKDKKKALELEQNERELNWINAHQEEMRRNEWRDN